MIERKLNFPLILIILSLFVQNGIAKDEKMDETFDFIIVGGGTAGCVIANRLSEITEWKILLLEDGDEPKNILTKIPALTPTTIFTEPLWNFTTETDDSILKGFENNQIIYQGGKSLGGSSSINFMMYTRGNREDFNRWEKLGNPGWSYKDVLPYFLKSEQSNLGFSEKPYHNSSGLLSIEYSYMSDGAKNFLHTTKNLGYNIIDYNGENQFGFAPIQATIKRGRRVTVNDAFLKPITKNRKNLKILTSTQVIKLIYDQTNPKIVRAVKFIRNNKLTRVLARKEVILSAGVINTPKLLMLSGIGPKEDLEQLEIPSINDLESVGKNLQDHLTYLGLNFLTNSYKNELELTLAYIRQLPVWYLTGRGMFASLGGFETIGYAKSDKAQNQNYPDFEFLFTNTIINSLFKKFTNLKDEVYEKYYKPVEKEIEWTIYPVILHPKSKGSMKLRSKDFNDPPLIYPNYFSNPDDIEMMMEAINFVLKLIKTNEFKRLNLTLNTNLVPDCEDIFNDNEYWECAIRTLTTTTGDQFGTCRMGSKDNLDSVVDHRFRVYGLDNLRIGDASVIPTTISGHLYATTVMIGERLADFVKEDYISEM